MKKSSTILFVLGAILLTYGLTDVLRIKLQIVDTTPPKILYTYPENSMKYAPQDIDSYIVYVQDEESKVISATYTDNYTKTTVNLQLVVWTNVKHPLKIISRGLECKFPDVNFDGYVDYTDADLLKKAMGTNDSRYDIVPDGFVNNYDIVVLGVYFGTCIFQIENKVTYPKGITVNFLFNTLNEYGQPANYRGIFNVGDYTLLKGVWTINNMTVVSGTRVYIDTYEVNVTFTKDSSVTISDSDINVTVTLDGTTKTLDYIGTGKWQKTITLNHGENVLYMKALSSSAENSIAVSVVTLTQEIPLSYVITSLGVICIVLGIVIEKKKETIIY